MNRKSVTGTTGTGKHAAPFMSRFRESWGTDVSTANRARRRDTTSRGPGESTSADADILEPTLTCQKIRVGIVILTCDNWDQTEQCLASVSKLDFDSFRVIMVDNGSKSPCPERILAGFPNVELLVNQQNLGYAQGCNIAIRHARRANHEYIWLLNNDTQVQPGSLAAMVELCDADPQLGAAGSVLLDPGPERRVQAWGGGKVNFLTGLSSPALGKSHDPLDYICGASLLVRSRALD